MYNEIVSYLPALFIVFLLVRRTQKSRRLRPKLIWISPALLLVLGAAYTTVAVQKGPPLALAEALIIAGAALAGAALGALRGQTVHLTRHPETGDIESKLSMWGLVIILAWLVGRNVLHRVGMQGATTGFGVFNDAMIALAIASVTTRAIVLFKRCASVEALPGNEVGGNQPS